MRIDLSVILFLFEKTNKKHLLKSMIMCDGREREAAGKLTDGWQKPETLKISFIKIDFFTK